MVEEIRADKLKYLELLQGAITRLAGNSFAIKGWSVTLSTGTLAYLMKDGNPTVAALALIPAVVFAILDAYYLLQEKRLRNRYREAVSADEPSFDLTPLESWRDVESTVESYSWYGLHAMLVAVILVVCFWPREDKSIPINMPTPVRTSTGF